MGAGIAAAMAAALGTKTEQELEKVKSEIDGLGLTVEDGKLCINVENENDEEGE